jgi:hypothetical protein
VLRGWSHQQDKYGRQRELDQGRRKLCRSAPPAANIRAIRGRLDRGQQSVGVLASDHE